MSDIVWGTPGFLDLGDQRLEHASWGPAPDKAATLVLLHEGLGSVGLWRDVPHSLAAATGLGVLAYSRSGYGASSAADLPRPVDYMSQEAIGVLPRMLGAFGLQKTILVGHSDGATIAAVYAGLQPDSTLAALILIAPHFFTEPVGLAAIGLARDAYEQGDLKTRMARHHVDPDNAFYGWNKAWLNPAFQDWNVEYVLRTISVPVLALQGADDQYGTLAQIDTVSRLCPTEVTRRVIADCGHAPHLEKPGETTGHIVDFVAKVTR